MMMRCRYPRLVPAILGLLASWSLSPSATAHLPCRYTVEIIEGPMCGPSNSILYLTDLNDAGAVCGYWFCPGSYIHHAIIWDPVNGLRAPTLPPNTTWSEAVDITNDGTVYGWWSNGQVDGGVYISNGMNVETFNPFAMGIQMVIEDVNDLHTMVGWWSPKTTPDNTAFRWNSGVLEDLGPLLESTACTATSIGNDGTICGYRIHGLFPNTQGFIIQPDKTVDFLENPKGTFATEMRALNNNGVGIGFSKVDNGSMGLPQGFIWRNGEQKAIPPDPTFPDWWRFSLPADINDDEVVVGHWRNEHNPGLWPFLLHHGHIASLVELMELPLQDAKGNFVNAAGQVAGHGSSPDLEVSGIVGFVMTPVPMVEGDVNCDEIVNVDDLLGVIHAWGGTSGREDINEDRLINHMDLLLVIDNWMNGG